MVVAVAGWAEGGIGAGGLLRRVVVLGGGGAVTSARMLAAALFLLVCVGDLAVDSRDLYGSWVMEAAGGWV